MAGFIAGGMARALPAATRVFPWAAPKAAKIAGLSDEARAAKGMQTLAERGYTWPAFKSGEGPSRFLYPLATSPKTTVGMPAMGIASLFGGDDPTPTTATPETAQELALPLRRASDGLSGLSLEDLYAGYSSFADNAGEAPAWPGSVMDYINDPVVSDYVDQQISAMQAPYRRQIPALERRTDKQVAGIEAAGAESARMGRALRREEEASRRQYSKQAQQRQKATTDHLADLADKLMGGSNVDEMFAGERGKQQLESIGRTGEAMARESSLGAGGSLDTMSVMADLDAVEKMRDAQDIKDAREQAKIDAQDIEDKISDIALQRPELARQFAMDEYNAQLAKYKEESANYRARASALNDFYLKILDNQLKETGSDFDFNEWLNKRSEDVAFSATRKGMSPLGETSVTDKLRPMQELRKDPMAWNSFLKDYGDLVAEGYDPGQAAEYLYGLYQQDMSEAWEKLAGQALGQDITAGDS